MKHIKTESKQEQNQRQKWQFFVNEQLLYQKIHWIIMTCNVWIKILTDEKEVIFIRQTKACPIN